MHCAQLRQNQLQSILKGGMQIVTNMHFKQRMASVLSFEGYLFLLQLKIYDKQFSF